MNTDTFSSFKELGISESLLRAIEELGYVQPMPIQAQVIPVILGLTDEGVARDVVGLAQTGTGKTAAFGLPLLQELRLDSLVPQALVLAPTRELCLQIAGDLQDYAKYLPGCTVLPVYGGSSIGSQMGALRKGVHVIVATPGRLIDLMERGAADLTGIRTLVLDEADEMLSMGFSDDIDAILAGIPSEHRTMLFSATMPAPIARISRKYMHKPVEITIGHKNEGAANVSHVYYMVHAKDKYAALKRIVDYYPNIYGIIFCRTKAETQEIASQLMAEGYNADTLHGDLSQPQRDHVMQMFRMRHLQLLVATDVAARGLDVDDLTHIINYGLPDDLEVYTHRSGRTGRAGKRGTSIAIIHTRERRKLAEIERTLGKTFERGTVPTARKITEKQLFNLADRLEKVEVQEEEIAPLLGPIYKKLSWLSTEDLIKRIVSLEFNRMINFYKGSDDLDIPEEPSHRGRTANGSGRGEGNAREPEPGYARMFVNLGKRDGIRPKDIMALLNTYVKRRVAVGRIDLLANFSFFEVPEEDARFVIIDMRRAVYHGRRVVVDSAEGMLEAPHDKSGKNGPEAPGAGGAYAHKTGRKDTGSSSPSRSRENRGMPAEPPFWESLAAGGKKRKKRRG